jgi:glucose-1-phosphate adenylyltransferase
MDYAEMLDWHHERNADVTIATIQVPPSDAGRFGVAEIDDAFRVVGFEEKPQHGAPKPSRFDPAMVSASMGIYVFRTPVLLAALHEDAQDPESSHDFARDVLPRLLSACRVIAYDFRDINAKQVRYWRDVGTLDAYYEANMDLVDVVPEFNLYDQRWVIRTKVTQQPPAKFVFAQEGRRMGIAVDSIVSAGVIVSGGRVLHSVLSPGVRVNSYCEVEYSILMPGVEVGRNSRVRRAILNTGVKIPDSSVIGFDLDADRAKGYHVTECGIVVVA